MRIIRNLAGSLLVASMASLAYAWAPAQPAAVAGGNSITSSEATLAVQQDETKPPKQDETKPPKQDQSKPPKKTKKEKHPKTRTDQQVPPGQQDKPSKEQKPNQAERDQKQPGTEHQDHSQPGAEHQDHAQPSGGHARIPDRDFKAHFGRPHAFRVRQVITTTQIVPNQTQFVYSGYTFVFLDPWPNDWNPDDDCYIDYVGNEYVLIDVAHPGMQIALSIVAG